ncbi:hypothetical protein PT974_07702 [Cladobotryum mycophilum]|uniref:Rhodopsin domain-containing protein n=1 Tax=Cladobotryum mycophilum TaxID=491253 RepID=A0ABR0SI27_9HYPO
MAVHLPFSDIQMIVVNTIFLVLSIGTVIARFYARHLQRKTISLDDHFIVASLVFTTAVICIGYATALDGGAGLHTKDASKEQIAMIFKLYVPASLLWVLATSFLKLSILCFYLSIFTTPKFRIAVYVVMGLTAAHFAVVVLRAFLLCRPVAFNWDKSITGTCGDRVKAYLATCVLNLLIDLSVVALPMPALWSLKMPLKKKLAVSGILGLGLVICGITAARVKFVLELDPKEFAYNSATQSIVAALELELGIVNGCLPILRPLVRKFFGQGSIPTKSNKQIYQIVKQMKLFPTIK